MTAAAVGRTRTRGRACWLVSLAAAVPAAATEEPAAKLSPLLGQVLERVAPASRDGAARAGGAAGAADAAGESGLFRRLAQQHRATLASPDNRNPGAGAGAVPTLSPAFVPALGYAMEQLDPVTFAVLRPLPVAGSGALLRTGDVFVLQFSTSLPGRVRLENIDTTGRVADLGTHTVLVDQLNRIPRDKGIQLQGQPGLERLRFYFYPCLPAEAAGKPWAAEFQGKLPPCTAAPVLQSAHLGNPAGNPAGAYGTVVPRALVNLTQPDTHLVFAGSPEYQPGDVTLMEAQIRHEGRGHGR